MFIYLASPYTNDPDNNFKLAEAHTAKALKQGLVIFSPIVHCHEIAKEYNLPPDFDFWQNYNFGMLRSAEVLHVLMIEGWEDSKGVQAEIDFAVQHDISILYKAIN